MSDMVRCGHQNAHEIPVEGRPDEPMRWCQNCGALKLGNLWSWSGLSPEKTEFKKAQQPSADDHNDLAKTIRKVSVQVDDSSDSLLTIVREFEKRLQDVERKL